MDSDYLRKILTAKVYDVAKETPLDPLNSLSKHLKNTVLLKREDLQPRFFFLNYEAPTTKWLASLMISSKKE